MLYSRSIAVNGGLFPYVLELYFLPLMKDFPYFISFY